MFTLQKHLPVNSELMLRVNSVVRKIAFWILLLSKNMKINFICEYFIVNETHHFILLIAIIIAM